MARAREPDARRRVRGKQPGSDLLHDPQHRSPGSYRAVAAAIQQMLAQIYMNVTILPTDFQSLSWLRSARHDFDIAEAGWVADFNDAATFLELLQTGGGNNDGQYIAIRALTRRWRRPARP